MQFSYPLPSTGTEAKCHRTPFTFSDNIFYNILSNKININVWRGKCSTCINIKCKCNFATLSLLGCNIENRKHRKDEDGVKSSTATHWDHFVWIFSEECKSSFSHCAKLYVFTWSWLSVCFSFVFIIFHRIVHGIVHVIVHYIVQYILHYIL